MRPLARGVSRSLFVAAVLFVAADTVTAQAPRSVTPVRDFELHSVKMGSDVAWRSDNALVVAAAWEGVIEVDLVTRKERLILGPSASRAQYGEGSAQSIWGAYRVATEGDLMLVTAPVGAFVWGWKDGEYHQMQFADARDYDLLNGHAFVVGVSGERARWGSMNPPATMWTVLLRGETASVKPLRGGPDPRPLYHCTMTLNAAVARMPNGTVAVAPGFSPGVTLLDAHGREIRSWATDGLGYHDRCDVSEEQGVAMGKNSSIRFEWLNDRETLEDMIGTSDGPLLVIRQPRPDGTAWRGILLRFRGKPLPVSIPVKSPSHNALLRASARGSRVAFVIYDAPLGPGDETLRTRIVIARLSP